MRVWARRVAVVVMSTVGVAAAACTEAAASVAPEPSQGATGPALSVSEPRSASFTNPLSWDWPLRPEPAVLARFNPPAARWASGHRGVDLAASVGQEVLSPADGVVVWSGVVVDRGVVVVATAAGLRSTLEPVDGLMPIGTVVTRGEPIGTVTGAPGHCAPVTCLHWGVLRGSVYLDPLAFVGAGHLVLLPLWPP